MYPRAPKRGRYNRQGLADLSRSTIPDPLRLKIVSTSQLYHGVSTYPTRRVATSCLSQTLHGIRTGTPTHDPKITLCPNSEVMAGDSWEFEEDGNRTDTQLMGLSRRNQSIKNRMDLRRRIPKAISQYPALQLDPVCFLVRRLAHLLKAPMPPTCP